MYNRFEMDEVELFFEQIPLNLHVNSPIDNLYPLLLGGNDDNCNVSNPLLLNMGRDMMREKKTKDNVVIIVLELRTAMRKDVHLL